MLHVSNTSEILEYWLMRKQPKYQSKTQDIFLLQTKNQNIFYHRNRIKTFFWVRSKNLNNFTTAVVRTEVWFKSYEKQIARWAA